MSTLGLKMLNDKTMQSCVCVKAKMCGNISTYMSSYHFTCIKTVMNAKCYEAL